MLAIAHGHAGIDEVTAIWPAHICCRAPPPHVSCDLSCIRPASLGDRFMTGGGDIAQYRCCPDLASWSIFARWLAVHPGASLCTHQHSMVLHSCIVHSFREMLPAPYLHRKFFISAMDTKHQQALLSWQVKVSAQSCP